MKSRKTEKWNPHGESLTEYPWKNTFNYSALRTELFRNISGDKTEKTEKLKNCCSREIQGEILHKKTVFQFFSFAYGTIPEHFRKQNWKTVFFPERSRERFSIKKQFFSFSVLLTEVFRNISGDKTEKLKNCFFQRDPGRDSPKKNSFSVFQFCLRNYSGTFPETKLKNWKTEKLFFSWRISPLISLEKTVFQFFSFCLRNSSGTFPETKLKNWKTVFYGESLPGSLWKKTVFQFFQFCLRNSSGTFPENKTKKLKNCFFYGESLPGCLWKKTVFQFFSFSVLRTEVFRNIPHFLVVQCMSYIFIYELDMWPPKRSLPNLEVKMCLKHCKKPMFFWKM